jgi:hypothetical protein
LNHKTLLSNEATLASMMQAQIDRENSLKTYENQYEFQMRQDFEAAMSSLNPRLYDKDLDRCKRQMNPESGNWLNNNQSFKAWLDQTDKSTQVLWLQGIPGAGEIRLERAEKQNKVVNPNSVQRQNVSFIVSCPKAIRRE